MRTGKFKWKIYSEKYFRISEISSCTDLDCTVPESKVQKKITALFPFRKGRKMTKIPKITKIKTIKNTQDPKRQRWWSVWKETLQESEPTYAEISIYVCRSEVDVCSTVK